MSETPVDLSLEHLQAELGRIDLLIRREVRRWQLAGQDPNDNFRGLYMSDTQVNAMLNRPFGTSWGHMVDLSPEDAESLDRGLKQLARYSRDVGERAQRLGQVLRLEHLQRTFELSEFEMDVILVCLAPHLDLRYERVYGYLQDDVTRKRPTVNLMLDLLGEPGIGRLKLLKYFAETANFFKHGLLERAVEPGAAEPPLLGLPLSLDKSIVSWLLGDYHTGVELRDFAQLVPVVSRQAIDSDILSPDIRAELQHAAKGQPVLVFHGADHTNQQTAALVFAAQLQRPLMMIQLAGLIESGISPIQATRLGLRDARINRAIPFFSGWDAVLKEKSPQTDVFAEICEYPDVVIVGGKDVWFPMGISRNRPLHWMEFPIPDYPQRLALWQHFLQGKIDHAADMELKHLAGQFLLSTGQVRDAVASAMDRVAQSGRQLHIGDLFTAARAHSNPSLSNLARKITPRYGWDDIILPEDHLTILHEIVDTVRGRPIVMEMWGVGKKLAASSGVSVLFAGSPGTGKTMAAEVIANELKLDLYKIDLSTVVSKYIGETEKNLEKIFTEAQSSNAILFFDEADALFGKRSEVKDAHDKYANIEIAYLLQRMEAYDGVTILATNLRANLDEAFTRRLQFALDIPFPEEKYRLRIWNTLFPPDVPRAADVDFRLLTERFKLAGGNIRNVIVSAAFLAASDDSPVTMRHLFHATRRELQKMGRLVKEEDLRVN